MPGYPVSAELGTRGVCYTKVGDFWRAEYTHGLVFKETGFAYATDPEEWWYSLSGEELSASRTAALQMGWRRWKRRLAEQSMREAISKAEGL